ncbi:MAG: TRAP transporter small permease [Alphaproteobacteria bacterium]|nr:TRAP transporter small permease [Alphaproteobacteria bacterium]
MNTIGRVIDRTAAVLCDLGGCLLVALTVLINVEVVLRYLFGGSTLIADEYGGYLFVWLTLLGFGHALRTGQFLRVEAGVERFGPRLQAACGALAALVGMAVAAVATWACFNTFALSLRFGTVSIQPSATPLWLPQAVMPFAMGWLCLLYLDALVRSLKALDGRP